MPRLVPTGHGTEVVEIGPQQCVNGHPLRFPNVLISTQPCDCTPGGHRAYQCLTCEEILYVPEHRGGPFGQGSAYG